MASVTSMCHRAILPVRVRLSAATVGALARLLAHWIGVGDFRRLPPHFCDDVHFAPGAEGERRATTATTRRHRGSAATHSTGNRPTAHRSADQTAAAAVWPSPALLLVPSNEIERVEKTGKRGLEEDDDNDTIGARSCIRDGR